MYEHAIKDFISRNTKRMVILKQKLGNIGIIHDIAFCNVIYCTSYFLLFFKLVGLIFLVSYKASDFIGVTMPPTTVTAPRPHNHIRLSPWRPRPTLDRTAGLHCLAGGALAALPPTTYISASFPSMAGGE
jgi:hypothetical protein